MNPNVPTLQSVDSFVTDRSLLGRDDGVDLEEIKEYKPIIDKKYKPIPPVPKKKKKAI